MTFVLIRAHVEADHRHELMQMCQTWLSGQLTTASLERRVYEDAMSPTRLLLVEEWWDEAAMNSHLSSESFRALIGAVKVLGKLIDIHVCQVALIESG